MNTQVVYNTEAYVVTDLVSNESWLLARVELCNGTCLIIRGKTTRLYQTRRRFEQAWGAMLDEVEKHGWSRVIA